MKILLVEDEPFMQEAMCSVIERTGVGVLKTDNINMAKEILRTELVNLLITDLYLPKPDGYELINHIKSNEGTAHIPVIVISGIDDECTANAEGIHADIYLKKPFTLEDLRKAIGKFSLVAA